jgi:hypothetical protein
VLRQGGKGASPLPGGSVEINLGPAPIHANSRFGREAAVLLCMETGAVRACQRDTAWAMSEENAELFYKWNKAFNRRDLDALLALADPDIELLSRIAEVEGGGPYRGHDGVRSWWESLFSISPDYSAELEEVRDLGKVTLARVQNRGHGLGSDAPMGETSWDVIEWRHKKAIWWGIYRSEDEALEAAGLSA